MCEGALNKSGHYRYAAMSGKRIKWKEGDFKYYIYKPFLDVYMGKKSTMEQNTEEPSEVSLALSAHFHTEYGVQLPSWPSLR